MARRVFVWGYDEEYSVEGWIPKGMPDFNALNTAYGLVHDVMEHTDRDDGSLAHELRAFGAMLYIRGDSGWFYRSGGVGGYVSNVYSELGDLLVAGFSGVTKSGSESGARIWEPPPTRPLPDDSEHELQEAIRKAVGYVNEYGHPDEELTLSTPVVQQALGWMRSGYRLCKRRFHGRDCHALGNTFQRLCDQLEGKMSIGEHGDELVIRVSNRTLEHKITHKVPDGPDYDD